MSRAFALASALVTASVISFPSSGQSPQITREKCFISGLAGTSEVEYCVRKSQRRSIPASSNYPLGERDIWVDGEIPTSLGFGEEVTLIKKETGGLDPINLWTTALRRAGWLQFREEILKVENENSEQNVTVLKTYVHEQDRSSAVFVLRKYIRYPASPNGYISLVEAYLVSHSSPEGASLPIVLEFGKELEAQ